MTARHSIDHLTDEVRAHVAAGKSDSDIAAIYRTSPSTVRRMRERHGIPGHRVDSVREPVASRADLVAAARPARTRTEYVADVAARVGELTARAAAVRQPGTVPACPVCGYQPGGMGRYVSMRPHKQRRMTRDGVRVTDDPCPGSGVLPEYVIPLRNERNPR